LQNWILDPFLSRKRKIFYLELLVNSSVPSFPLGELQMFFLITFRKRDFQFLKDSNQKNMCCRRTSLKPADINQSIISNYPTYYSWNEATPFDSNLFCKHLKVSFCSTIVCEVLSAFCPDSSLQTRFEYFHFVLCWFSSLFS
jgi:hypothetical protein